MCVRFAFDALAAYMCSRVFYPQKKCPEYGFCIKCVNDAILKACLLLRSAHIFSICRRTQAEFVMNGSAEITIWRYFAYTYHALHIGAIQEKATVNGRADDAWSNSIWRLITCTNEWCDDVPAGWHAMSIVTQFVEWESKIARMLLEGLWWRGNLWGYDKCMVCLCTSKCVLDRTISSFESNSSMCNIREYLYAAWTLTHIDPARAADED